VAVLVRNVVVGMTTDVYDQVAPPLIAKLKTQPGFLMHVAYPGPDGLMVGEVWESQAQHDKWFSENVKPNLPPDAEVRHEVIELHNVVKP